MTRKDVIILLVLLAFMAVVVYHLPEKVPIHFDSAGEADIIVDRIWLLLALPIPYSLYWKYFRTH